MPRNEKCAICHGKLSDEKNPLSVGRHGFVHPMCAAFEVGLSLDDRLAEEQPGERRTVKDPQQDCKCRIIRHLSGVRFGTSGRTAQWHSANYLESELRKLIGVGDPKKKSNSIASAWRRYDKAKQAYLKSRRKDS